MSSRRTRVSSSPQRQTDPNSTADRFPRLGIDSRFVADSRRPEFSRQGHCESGREKSIWNVLNPSFLKSLVFPCRPCSWRARTAEYTPPCPPVKACHHNFTTLRKTKCTDEMHAYLYVRQSLAVRAFAVQATGSLWIRRPSSRPRLIPSPASSRGRSGPS